VRCDEQVVNRIRVERAISLRYTFDDADSLPIA
jgi:hypothetical protein